jgi:Flp pilus assembly pilin Flp
MDPMSIIGRFFCDSRGSVALEYALIGSIISMAIVVAAIAIGAHLSTMLAPVADAL